MVRWLLLVALAALASGAIAAPVPPPPPAEVQAPGCWRITCGSRRGLIWLFDDGRYTAVLGLHDTTTAWWWGQWWIDRTGALVLVTDEGDVFRDQVRMPPHPSGWFTERGYDTLPLSIERQRPVEYYPEPERSDP